MSLYDAAGGSAINQCTEVGDYIQRQDQEEAYKIVSCQFLEPSPCLSFKRKLTEQLAQYKVEKVKPLKNRIHDLMASFVIVLKRI